MISFLPRGLRTKLDHSRDDVHRCCMHTPTCVVLIMEFRCDEVKIEESEKARSRRESNPGHLACAASALPLSYDNWTTTSLHNPLKVVLNASVTHLAATQ